MQFIDLKSQQKRIRDKIEERLRKVLDHGQYILGAEVAELERELEKFAGVKYAVSVSSGTDALLVAMMALGVKPGDEIITTPFTFIATAETIALLGAVPVFVDIEEDTYNINANLIKEKITKKTKGIIPVSLFGQIADMDAINKIAKDNNLWVIEDAAQSFGAIYKEKKSCSLSTIGVTSFFPAKPLGCYGDGGACFTDDEKLKDQMLMIRNHGQKEKYLHHELGINGRLDTMQAAILLEKMKIFPEEIELRNRAASYYYSNLSADVNPPQIRSHNTSVFAQYTLRNSNRDKIQKHVQEQGIPIAVYYPIAMHLQPVFSQLAYSEGSMPVTEAVSKEVFSIPMHPYLTEEDQKYIVNTINGAL